MDLQRFGQELRELRESLGLSQDQVVERSDTYAQARGLRKIESGTIQPPREKVIRLVTAGMKVNRTSVVNRLLDLAGYGPLLDSEILAADLQVDEIPIPRVGVSTAPAVQDIAIQSDEQKPPNGPQVGKFTGRLWPASIAVALPMAVILMFVIRSTFIAITSALYAGMYAVSVLLESTYEYRGRETVLAALSSLAITWPAALAALWLDQFLAGQAGLWWALAVLLIAATVQWVTVAPSLAPYRIVPLDYHAHTARAAHLKNSVYFALLFGIPFWILPAHCSGNPDRPSTLCPPPYALWILMLVYVAFALIMGRDLLPHLIRHDFNDRYELLVYARAALFFILCLISTMWYASSFR